MSLFARSRSKTAGLVVGLALVFASAVPTLAGTSLDTFQNFFVRYTYAGLKLPVDYHQNAMVGHTVLLPTPGDGSGKAASVSVTLDSDEPFFLPLFQLLGTSYSDGTPNDKLESITVFKTLDLSFKVDGKQVISGKNALRYYSSFYFSPVVPLVSPPIKGIIWLEGVGYISPPLLPGKHTLVLHVKNTKPVFGSSFVEYNNTFVLNVLKPTHR